MKKLLIRLNAFLKGFLYFIKPHLLFGFLARPFLFASNVLTASKWISNQSKSIAINDFYSPSRNYNKRLKLYEAVRDSYQLNQEAIVYLEFGVCGGSSFFWWLDANQHPDSVFYGFDTFEGLPENWGLMYKQGDMHAEVPQLSDSRATFLKGLFQQTVFPFLTTHRLADRPQRKVIHLDADLFSSTLFALTALAPYLRKGDILLFDEFNTPNHEFFAWDIFVKSYYVEYKLIGAVNNYYQIALEITGI